jgi:ketosteroid isomerase-like protein
VTDTAVVTAYFEAIRARDADRLGSLFSPDAELVSGAGTFRGPEAIAGFYRDLVFLVEDLWPDPGPFEVVDNAVTVEIHLRMNNVISVVDDYFTLGDGVITKLVIEPRP